MSGRLTIVGTGIRLVGQITVEALEAIRRADRVLYLGGDAAMSAWLGEQNAAAESLADSYAEGRPRRQTYREMVDRILAPVRAGQHVVAAFYGHPGVGVEPAHAAMAEARAEGYRAEMLPGVSAEACLVADLGVDPLLDGWQSHEAWRFVTRRPRFDPHSPLVLWQVGMVYETSIRFDNEPNRRGLRDIGRTLARYYPPSHVVVLYEASPFPVCDPRIEPVTIADLPKAEVPIGTTLYVPPLATPPRRRPARRSPR